MKRIFLLLFCLFVLKTSFALEPLASTTHAKDFSNTEFNTQIQYSANYQQFKTQFINLETKEYQNLASLRKRGKDDYLMLYVAGGIAVATAALILTNNPENFVTNNASDVNTGIALGGTLACGLIVAKFIVDRNR